MFVDIESLPCLPMCNLHISFISVYLHNISTFPRCLHLRPTTCTATDAKKELLTEALGALLSVLWRTRLFYCIKLMQPECSTLFHTDSPTPRVFSPEMLNMARSWRILTDTIALCSKVCNLFVGYMDAMI